MADERTLARRYARALLDVAIEAKKVDETERDLHELAELWHASEDVRTLIAHPRWSRERKKELLAGLLAGKVQPLTIRFLERLIENGRLSIIAEIADEYDHISDELQEITKARVTTFLPLNDKQRKRLEEKLHRYTRRPNIELEERVDPAILGGIVVQVGSFLLDGSVAGRLRKLRERLVLPPEEVRQRANVDAGEAAAT
jgi:F-type H+-transporting ATPase subunit delta